MQHHSPNPAPADQAAAAPDDPDPQALRHRAGQLRRLATSIEGSLAMSLVDAASGGGWDTNRARLCDRMLHRNLHQLHQAADELREAALDCCHRADELEGRHQIQVA